MRFVYRLCLLMGVVGVVGTMGCIGSKTHRCSWGAVCPADRYCEESLMLCLYPRQAEVCRGVDDSTPLTECTFTDAPPGAYACQGGLCLRSLCGDGRLGPREVCDDGNTVGGDGCSGDCLSGETCGNGLVDPAAGESCDDGNHMSHDGCSSGCTDESVYTELLSSNLPERFGAAAAYDPVRQRTVVFGGFTSEFVVLTDTWEYDGEVWRKILPSYRPGGRLDASLAYLPSRGRMVLFAGWTGYEALNDLWEFDGTSWSYVALPMGAPWRSYFGLVYDTREREVVLFGGTNSSSNSTNETWAYFYDSNWPDEICHGGIDEDGDELIDCADPDCDGRPCSTSSVCTAGVCQ